MTSASTDPSYPQYCFHLSPTVNRWCHLRAWDIHALTSQPGFEGQNVFFHLNHPVKWVRIAGVVVSIDDYANRRIYTIDDSSGTTIECVVQLPKACDPSNTTGGAQTGRFMAGDAAANTDGDRNRVDMSGRKAIPIDSNIDIGHMLDVKGGLKTFRDVKQIHVEKIVHLRSTQQEVQFWGKIAKLRTEILSKPWILDKREVRRCRKEAEGRDPKSKGRATSNGSDKDSRKAEPLAKRMKTGLERRTKPKRTIQIEGHYGALGI